MTAVYDSDSGSDSGSDSDSDSVSASYVTRRYNTAQTELSSATSCASTTST